MSEDSLAAAFGLAGADREYLYPERVKPAAADQTVVGPRRPVRVFSGVPGSGKTRALVEAMRVAAKHVDSPPLFLPVTFNHHHTASGADATLAKMASNLPVCARLLHSQLARPGKLWEDFVRELLSVPEIATLTVGAVVNALLSLHRCGHAVIGAMACTCTWPIDFYTMFF
jgi:hypothetical protein